MIVSKLNKIQQKELFMNIRKLSFKTTAVLFLLGAALLLGSSMVYAEASCQIIKITNDKAGGDSSVQIIPEKVTVPVGTCTIWVNFDPHAGVRIRFQENAKECLLSTWAPTGFQESELKTNEVCNISNMLGRGQTGSLVWTKPGIFKYTIETLSLKDNGYVKSAEGIIEVK